MAKCSVCDGNLTVLLPVADGDMGSVDERPCPICRPWQGGFGGLTARFKDSTAMLIPPLPAESQPEEDQ
jgi:hypothetical protein